MRSNASNFFLTDLSHSPKIGDTVTILVEGSAQPYELNFIVIGPKGISKHQTFDEEDFNQNDDKLSFEFSFKVTNSMAPLAHVIVFYIQGSGEVIYDQLMIEMSSPSTNHVSSIVENRGILKLRILKIIFLAVGTIHQSGVKTWTRLFFAYYFLARFFCCSSGSRSECHAYGHWK